MQNKSFQAVLSVCLLLPAVHENKKPMHLHLEQIIAPLVQYSSYNKI